MSVSPSSRPVSWHRGIANTGNTCYASAVFHLLRSSVIYSTKIKERLRFLQNYLYDPAFRQKCGFEYGCEDGCDEMKNETNNLRKLWFVFDTLDKLGNTDPATVQEGRNILQPRPLFSLLSQETEFQNSNFMIHHSNDPHEFLILLLNQIVRWERTCRKKTIAYVLNPEVTSKQERRSHQQGQGDASRIANSAWNEHLKHDYSPFTDVFDGQLFYTTTCRSCGHQTHKPERFTNVKVEPYENVQESLERLFQTTEIIQNWRCDNCGKRDGSCERTSGIWRLPRVFIIQINRFDASGQNKKIPSAVFPSTSIDVSRYVSRSRPAPFVNSVYTLRSIVSHDGEYINKGHFRALVKHETRGNGDMFREWVLYDDDVVSSTMTTFKPSVHSIPQKENIKKQKPNDGDDAHQSEDVVLSQFQRSCYLLAYEK